MNKCCHGMPPVLLRTRTRTVSVSLNAIGFVAGREQRWLCDSLSPPFTDHFSPSACLRFKRPILLVYIHVGTKASTIRVRSRNHVAQPLLLVTPPVIPSAMRYPRHTKSPPPATHIPHAGAHSGANWRHHMWRLKNISCSHSTSPEYRAKYCMVTTG